MTRQTVIAYWLIPSEPAHSFFQRTINDFAHRYDAPVFEPHVTIHVGADRPDAAENALGDAARECKRIGLTPLGIDQSDEFIKTLFVQFVMSAELRKMNDIIRDYQRWTYVERIAVSVLVAIGLMVATAWLA